MIEAIPDLESRVEQSLSRVFRDAFPSYTIGSYGAPVELGGKSIGIKAERGAEDPIGTNMFPVTITIESHNFDEGDLQLLHDMIGNASNARATVAEYAAKQFSMPQGQAVEVAGAPRTVEEANERIVTYNLNATLQPS